MITGYDWLLLCSGHIGLPAFRHIVSDSRLQNIPLVLETPSFESTEIWTQEVDVLNQLSSMVGADDEAAVAEMKIAIEEAVKRVGGVANAAGKNKKVPRTTKRGRTTVAEQGSDEADHDH